MVLFRLELVLAVAGRVVLAAIFLAGRAISVAAVAAHVVALQTAFAAAAAAPAFAAGTTLVVVLVLAVPAVGPVVVVGPSGLGRPTTAPTTMFPPTKAKYHPGLSQN